VALRLAVGAGAEAPDLEPRAYSPAPVGTPFLLAAYAQSSGRLAE
jgi:hypothetical protein